MASCLQAEVRGTPASPDLGAALHLESAETFIVGVIGWCGSVRGDTVLWAVSLSETAHRSRAS